MTPPKDPTTNDLPPPVSATRDPSPFHPGERAVQTRAGVRQRVARVEDRLFRDFMPEPHRELFSKLPYLFVGSLDREHRPFASMLVGRPGFVSSPDARSLRIDAHPVAGDPLAANLQPGAAIALLGIELHTRRRNRLNGKITDVDGDGFGVRARQSFGNCPQYIQARAPLARVDAGPVVGSNPAPAHTAVGPHLLARAVGLVAHTDTFFIASASAKADGPDAADGVDVSHRGGRPGFVRASESAGQSVLTWPDFAGNSFFNTLGNLQVNPRAGLLFVDFDTGDLLSITGTATVVWSGAQLDSFEGAERLLSFAVDEGVFIEHAVPLRWSESQEAPEIEFTGSWNHLSEAEAEADPDPPRRR